jgi:hypothetical protein
LEKNTTEQGHTEILSASAARRPRARSQATLGIRAAHLLRPRAPSPGHPAPLDALKSPSHRVPARAPRRTGRTSSRRTASSHGVPFLCTVPRPTYSIPSTLSKHTSPIKGRCPTSRTTAAAGPPHEHHSACRRAMSAAAVEPSLHSPSLPADTPSAFPRIP